MLAGSSISSLAKFCALPYTLPVSQSSSILPSLPISLSSVAFALLPSILTGTNLAFASLVVLRFHANDARVAPTAAEWGE